MKDDLTSEPGEDWKNEDLRQRLTPLKSARPSTEFRQQLQAALSTQAAKTAQETAANSPPDTPTDPTHQSIRSPAGKQPLWQRRVSIPLPIAAAIVLTLSLLLGRDLMRMNAIQSSPPQTFPGSPVNDNTTHHTASAFISPSPPSESTSPLSDCAPSFRQDTITIAGISPITQSFYTICER